MRTEKPKFNPRQRTFKPRGAAPKRKKVTIDLKTLTQLVNQKKEVVQYESSLNIGELITNDRLRTNVLNKGYKKPTEIQELCFSAVQRGKNVVAIANTGTGKTAAFLMPLIEEFLVNSNKKPVMVIVPTRELALQVEEEFNWISKGMNLSSVSFIGGTSVNTDIRNLRGRSHNIYICTPGRMLDLMQQGAASKLNIQTLVLDEFDRMLDMGFINDIKKIVERLKGRSQTLLFSATRDKKQQQLIDWIAPNAEEFAVNSGESANEKIEQNIIKVSSSEDKYQLFTSLINKDEIHKVLVFADTKRTVDRLGKKLNQSGISTGVIHGDKSQGQRNRALDLFRHGKSKVLIATDVVARGIDIDDISHVINYQTPQSVDSYLHRIGRTGRAGKQGVAYTFFDQLD